MKLCSAPRLSKACAWVAVILWPGVAIGSCHTGEKPFHVVLKSLRIYPDAVTAPSRAASTGRPPHRLPPAFSTKLPEPPWIRARPHRTRPGLAGSWGAGGTQSQAQKPASNAGGFTVPEAAGGASSISPSGFSKRWSEFFLPTYLVLISSVRSRLLPLAGISERRGFQRLPLGSTQRAGVQVLD